MSAPAKALTPTPEQTGSIELFKNHSQIKIQAFAGAGKTSTLVLMAQANPVKSLYLAFNKAMAEEAKLKFPSWVEVRTTHSVAYAEFGRKLQNKLKRPQGVYQNVCGTGGEIARYFKMEAFETECGGVLTAAGMGLAVKETLAAFESSGGMEIEARHVSTDPLGKRILGSRKSAYFSTILKHAKLLWEKRIDTSSNILATHDTYMKLWQMSRPDLSSYEVIYLDEAQDTSDCMLDVINHQKDARLVLVGDARQGIYGWRGAVNAMQKAKYPEAQLTQSFRFGPAIGKVASAIIGETVKGLESIEDKVLSSNEELPEGVVPTILYRTNTNLILDAVEMLEQGKRVNLEVDVRDFIKLLEGITAMRNGDVSKVKHDLLVPYASWQDLAQDAQEDKGELGRVYKMEMEGRTGKVLAAMHRQQNTSNPDMLLTTAHKSKGREWDVVQLANDFPSSFNSKGERVRLPEQEINLMYVAATRAKKLLKLCGNIEDLMHKGENPQVAITVRGFAQIDAHTLEGDLERVLAKFLPGVSKEELSEAAYLDAALERELEDFIREEYRYGRS